MTCKDEQLSLLSLCFLVPKKRLLFDSSKAIGFDFIFVECQIKTETIYFICTIFGSILNVLSMRCLWCQRRRQQTISIHMLQFIIAIISINSIQTWHLAWFCPFFHFCWIPFFFSSFSLSISLFLCILHPIPCANNVLKITFGCLSLPLPGSRVFVSRWTHKITPKSG